ncbi:MAG: hypothetical protein PHW76_09820 [Alphaproteobacteria bacterium]|nr:hypothetical protein [Alphaproteobacteria bacterium]
MYSQLAQLKQNSVSRGAIQKAKEATFAVKSGFKSSAALICKTIVVENILKLPKLGLFTLEKKLGLYPDVEGVEICGTPSRGYCEQFAEAYQKVPEPRRDFLTCAGMESRVGEYSHDWVDSWSGRFIHGKGDSRFFQDESSGFASGQKNFIAFSEKVAPTPAGVMIGVYEKTPSADLVDAVNEETLHQVFNLNQLNKNLILNGLYEDDIKALGGREAAFQKCPYYVQDINTSQGLSEVFANCGERFVAENFPRSSAWSQQYQANFDKTGVPPDYALDTSGSWNATEHLWKLPCPAEHVGFWDVLHQWMPPLGLAAMGICLSLSPMKKRDDFIGSDLSYIRSKLPAAKTFLREFSQSPFGALKTTAGNIPKITYFWAANTALLSNILRQCAAYDCSIPILGALGKGVIVLGTSLVLANTLIEGTSRPKRENVATRNSVLQPT